MFVLFLYLGVICDKRQFYDETWLESGGSDTVAATSWKKGTCVCVCVYVRDRDTKGEEMTYDLECE